MQETPTQSPARSEPGRGRLSIPELRRVCHEPVREFNDLTGALYGWRISIHVTRVLLGMRRSAAFASSLMVAAGLVGSVLCAFGGWVQTVGLALLASAYILDCVDGEMARYYGIDSFRWAAFDYLHHMLTKGFSFLCIGIGLFVDTGNPWLIVAGATCSVFWLILMGVRDLPTLLFGKKIVANVNRQRNPAYQRLRKHLERLSQEAKPARPVENRDIWGKDFRFQRWMIRTFFTSFDIVVPLLLLLSLADHFVAPLSGLAAHAFPLSLAGAFVLAYAVVLPLHTADCIWSAMKRGQVRSVLYDLAERVESFRDAP